MRKILTILTLSLVLSAAERETISFRLKKDPDAPQRAWLVSHDDDGFRIEYFGSGGRRATVQWSDVVDEDRRRLRIRLGLERSEKEKLGLIDGHELLFKGGGFVRGVLELVDEGGRHWLRHEGLVLPYPGDRIRAVSEIRIREVEVYTEEEIYLRRLERIPPVSAKQHRDLADYMYDIGNWEAAEEHYGEALRLDPSLRRRLTARIEEIREIRSLEEAQAHFRKAKSRAVLMGDYQGAIAEIRSYIEDHPEVKRTGLQVIETIRTKRTEKLHALYHRAKAEEFDRTIRRYLVRRQPTLEEAMAWVTGGLAEEVFKRVNRRLRLTEDEATMLKESRAKCALHWATYKDGTFIISERAKKGRTSQRQVRGDPEGWWHHFKDTATRSTFLKAYGAERLPELFEVVQVRTTPCIRCGGKGHVRVMMFMRKYAGPLEWKQRCPRCFGAREDRGVGYR